MNNVTQVAEKRSAGAPPGPPRSRNRRIGFAVLAPERRQEVFSLVWKALLAGFLATCMTASMVGALPDALFGVTPAAPPTAPRAAPR